MSPAAATAAAVAPSYRDFVVPTHPLVSELLGPPADREAGGAAALESTLVAARRRLLYDPTPGRHDFDALRRRLARAADRPLRINCIDGACALASHLRAGGFGEDEVWVCLGGRVSPIGADAGAEYHAWLAILAGGGRVLWIDPAILVAREVDGERILADHHFYVVFNDRRIHLRQAEMRHLLTAGARPSPRLYLFGRADAETSRALGEAAFGEAVVRLARSQVVEPDAVATADRERWVGAGLLAHDGDRLVAGRRLLVVPRPAEADAFAALGESVGRYLEVAADAVPRLERSYAATATARRWSWDEVAHAVVAGMLLDLSVGREFGILPRVGRRQGDSVVWAFEGVSTDNGLGVVWCEAPGGDWGAGQLWHRAVRRSAVRLSPAMVALAGRVAIGQPEPAAPREMLYLRHQRLVRRAGDGFEVTWPTFRPRDAARLSRPLRHGGRRLLSAAITPALATLAEHPWWGRCRDDDSYRHLVLRLMLEYGADRAFSSGLLADPPRGEAPETWGRWLWLGRQGDALPRCRDAGLEQGVEQPAARAEAAA